MTAAAGRHFEGEIRVAARVIDYLSSGLYQNAAACMKELINNSYDADATEVYVSVKPDADVIVVEDDGVGMTQSAFVEHFARVAESHKRDTGERTKADRLKIGKIGIGFIAANELCDELEIYSTVAGSADLLHVVIDFGKIRDRSYPERRREGQDVVKGDYEGEVLTAETSDHFTKIYLKQIRPTAIDQFLRPADRTGDTRSRSLYGLKPATVREVLVNLDSWDELDLYSQTRLRIGLNVPVTYLPEWYESAYSAQLDRFTQRAARSSFKVVYDGTELRKPTVLTELRGQSMVHSLNFEGEYVHVQGYLFARHGTLRPREENGLLIRVRESAVGEYDSDFLGYPKQLFPLFQDWVSGEIYVDGSLDDALNIDRRTLRDTHPAYTELQDWFIKEFGEFLRAVREYMYTEPSRERKASKTREQRDRIREVRKLAAQTLGGTAAAAIDEAFPTFGSEEEVKKQAKRFMKTYTAADVIETAIAVAHEVLPHSHAERFIAELTKRIS